MTMFETSNIIPLCPVDVSSIVEWITAIPFESWPQQNRLADGRLRPAMVNDPAWYGFADRVRWTVVDVMPSITERGYDGVKEAYNYMLSVVMPGHSIPPHADRQDDGWICRVHVPLITNRAALLHMATRGVSGMSQEWHLNVGEAFAVNVTQEHSIENRGDTPRIHLMFDVRRA